MFDWLKHKYFTKMEKNFNICMKLAELRAKIKNSSQPQVRSLNCQKSACPQRFSLAGNCGFSDLRTNLRT